MTASITTTTIAAARPTQPDWLADIRDRRQAAADDPFHVTDCEGDLSVWRQSALTHVIRNDNGEITGWSAPSSYKVTDHVIEISLDTWDEGEDPLDDQRRCDIHGLVTARDRDVPRLLAHIDQLQQRLDCAEAALPGITHLVPGEPVKVTVYRAEHSEDLEPLGLYTNRGAARAHGEAMAEHDNKQPGLTHCWIPDDGDPSAVEELSEFGPGEDDEDATGYVVVPVTVTSAYEPEAEE
ncbi:hypothetical protein OG883_41145 [Streptomyces sp. NBC_01142]|uniref:hypothetical protein n=1 Tax=Streptomyces sp. NBC_01142 TaxID=2975865 RepID=UPI002257CD6C|nr:hypothetical protein [Streptomyces sp. NBC_01142]MCX4826079.1 hypothetical protein [Streptomyces sp. NBC_01142]